MTKKVIGWVFLIYCILVGINYFFTNVVGGFFSYGGSARADDNRLGAIDFSLFDRNGTGRSYITQNYGRTPFSYRYPNGWHNGIDIAAVYGAPVYSPSQGTVVAVGNQDDYCYHRGFGRYVAVDDAANHLVLWYAHLGIPAVSAGDTVKRGSFIGRVGVTGLETGTHLHFSIFQEKDFSMPARNGCGPEPTGRDVDPLLYLGTTYQ